MLIASRLLGALAQAATLIVLARIAGPTSFGAFGAATAIGAVAIGFIALGTPTRALLVSAGELTTRAAIARAALLIALVVAVATYLISRLLFGDYNAAIIAAAAFSCAEIAVTIHQNLLFGSEELRRAELLMILRRALPLGAVCASIPWGGPVSLYALAAGACLSIVFSLILVAPLERVLARTMVSQLRKVVRESRPYWLTNIGSMAQQLDVTIVALFMGPSAAAGFAAGFRFASPVHIVTGLLVARMMPTVRAAQSVATNVLRDKFFRIGLGYAGVVLLAAPLAAFLVIALLGSSYSEYWPIIALFFVNSAVSVVNQLLAGWLFARGLGHRAIPVMTGIATAMGLSLVLIGAVAGNLVLAALGTVAIQVLLLGLASSYVVIQNKRDRENDGR